MGRRGTTLWGPRPHSTRSGNRIAHPMHSWALRRQSASRRYSRAANAANPRSTRMARAMTGNTDDDAELGREVGQDGKQDRRRRSGCRELFLSEQTQAGERDWRPHRSARRPARRRRVPGCLPSRKALPRAGVRRRGRTEGQCRGQFGRVAQPSCNLAAIAHALPRKGDKTSPASAPLPSTGSRYGRIAGCRIAVTMARRNRTTRFAVRMTTRLSGCSFPIRWRGANRPASWPCWKRDRRGFRAAAHRGAGRRCAMPHSRRG